MLWNVIICFIPHKTEQPIQTLTLKESKRVYKHLWLTDEVNTNNSNLLMWIIQICLQVIRLYMQLISDEASKAGKQVAVFHSQFVDKFESDGYKGVRRWYRKVDFHQQDILLAFINDCGCHWTLLVRCMYCW